MSSNKTGRAGLSFTLDTRQKPSDERSERPPLRVLVVADFSGRVARGLGAGLGARGPWFVNVERLGGAFAAFAATLQLPPLWPGGAGVELAPRDLDDLHPEQLLAGVPQLAELLALSARLGHDASAAARLTALLGGMGGDAAAEAVPAAASAEAPTSSGGLGSRPESGTDTLSRLLGGTAPSGQVPQPSAGPKPSGKLDVQQLVRNLIGGAAVAAAPPPPVPAGLAAAAERRLAEGLRSILAAPAFRALEASWRGLDGLVRHCPDEELVRYSALDASVAELVLDLPGLTQLLERGGFEVLVLDHAFRPVASELSALARLFELCAARGVTLLGGADATLAGCPRFDRHPDPDTWDAIWPEPERALWDALGRVRAAGGKLSLALPRFLQRQPYGAEGEPLEAFAFEEILDTEDHAAFAWGNGVYLLTRALLESRAGTAGRVYADGSVDVRELPVVRVERQGELQIEPCAELWLNERGLGRLRAAGFSVLQGVRDSDRVRVHL